jgi:hypothetical protein
MRPEIRRQTRAQETLYEVSEERAELVTAEIRRDISRSIIDLREIMAPPPAAVTTASADPHERIAVGTGLSQWAGHGGAATAGLVVWWLWHDWGSASPIPVRVVVSWMLFVIGPGCCVVGALMPRSTRFERLLAGGGAGLVASAVLAHAIGIAGATSAFPWIASALAGLGVRLLAAAPRSDRHVRRTEAMAAVVVMLVAISVGVIAYAHRLSPGGHGALVVNGDYDSYDSSYYAAMSAELANHRLPPESPFYAGHALAYSYYPQLVLAMVHRHGGVSLLDLYFRYAWPILIAMAALAVLLCVSRVASLTVGVLAAVLLLVGSDLSYVFAVFFRHARDWDDLIWSNNLLTPGAEMLTFNPWAPALCVLFTGLWGLARAEGGVDEKDRARGGHAGLVLASVCFGILVQFKPFAFAAVMAGLLATVVQLRAARERARRMAAVAAGALAVSAPHLIWIAQRYDDSQAVLSLGFGYGMLSTVVPAQLGIDGQLGHAAAFLGGGPGAYLVAILAGAVFLGAGLGARLLGLAAVVRALRARSSDGTVWRLLAWIVVAGAASPLFVVTQPYHQTFHVFHLSLFVLWLFVAREIIDATRAHAWRRAAIIVAVLACATPSTLHYLQDKWTDGERPFAYVGIGEQLVAERLRAEPPGTVLLAHYPDRPSLISILAERRVVLAWARYARNVAPLQAEIDDFFQSEHRSFGEAQSLLARSGATHLLETVGIDHINPELLARLAPVVSTGSLRLYEIPPPLRALSLVPPPARR